MTTVNNGTYLTQDGVGANDNDLLFTTPEVSNFDTFELLGTTGAVDVEVQLVVNGTWSTAPLSMQDLGATTLNPVLVTVAGRLYGFTGNFHAVRVRQNGAAGANYVLRAFNQ